MSKVRLSQCPGGGATLRWHRQLAGLRYLQWALAKQLWWWGIITQLPKDGYRDLVEGPLSMLSRKQVEDIRPLVDAVVRAHARIAPTSLQGDDARKYVEVLMELDEHIPEWAALKAAIRRRWFRVKREVCNAPSGPEKALDMLQAYVEVQPVRSCQCLAELVCLDRWGRDVTRYVDRVVEELRRNRQAYQEEEWEIPYYAENSGREPQVIGAVRPSEHSRIFWCSEPEQEVDDHFRFVSFVTHFGLSEFQPVAQEAEQVIENRMLNLVVAQSLLPPPFSPAYQCRAARVAAQFWPLVDLPETVRRLRPSLGLILRAVWAGQADGFWVHAQLPVVAAPGRADQSEFLPNPMITAAAALMLRCLGRHPVTQCAADKGVAWLLDHQHPDGFWRDTLAEHNKGADCVPSLEATCLAVKALVREDGKADKAVARAQQWLLNQQDSFGHWPEFDGYPTNAHTLLVLDTLRECRTPQNVRAPQSDYLRSSLNLLTRALEAIGEGDDAGVQVALILAHQAAELFAYACLEVRNVDIFTDQRRTETIGFACALTKVENQLRADKELTQGTHVPERPRLNRLIHLRGEVVHKGLRPNTQQAEAAINGAVLFMRNWCGHFHGFVPRGLG